MNAILCDQRMWIWNLNNIKIGSKFNIFDTEMNGKIPFDKIKSTEYYQICFQIKVET